MLKMNIATAFAVGHMMGCIHNVYLYNLQSKNGNRLQLQDNNNRQYRRGVFTVKSYWCKCKYCPVEHGHLIVEEEVSL